MRGRCAGTSATKPTASPRVAITRNSGVPAYRRSCAWAMDFERRVAIFRQIQVMPGFMGSQHVRPEPSIFVRAHADQLPKRIGGVIVDAPSYQPCNRFDRKLTLAKMIRQTFQSTRSQVLETGF